MAGYSGTPLPGKLGAVAERISEGSAPECGTVAARKLDDRCNA